jgi:hypothetical protein
VKRIRNVPGRQAAFGRAALIAAVLLGAGASAQTAAKPDKVALRAQLGIIYAQNGDNERARPSSRRCSRSRPAARQP